MDHFRTGTATWFSRMESARMSSNSCRRRCAPDMVPENPGTWMFHCHIDDPMEAGMSALYKAEPRRPAALMIGHLPYEIFAQNSIPWRFVL